MVRLFAFLVCFVVTGILAGCAGRHARVDEPQIFEIGKIGIRAADGIPSVVGETVTHDMTEAIAATRRSEPTENVDLSVFLSDYVVSAHNGGFEASARVSAQAVDIETGKTTYSVAFAQSRYGDSRVAASRGLGQAIATRLQFLFALATPTGWKPDEGSPAAPAASDRQAIVLGPQGDIFLNARTRFGSDGNIAAAVAPQQPVPGNATGQAADVGGEGVAPCIVTVGHDCSPEKPFGADMKLRL